MRLFLRVEIVLMVLVGAACALFTVTGVVGLVTGKGLASLTDLIAACFGGYAFFLLRGDIRRQRELSVDPHVQGFQDH